MDEHKHVWDDSGTCACGEYWGNYRKTLKPTPAAPGEEEERLAEEYLAMLHRVPGATERIRIHLAIYWALRKGKELGEQTANEEAAACDALEADLRAQLAAQAQAVERVQAQFDEARKLMEEHIPAMAKAADKIEALEAERDKLSALFEVEKRACDLNIEEVKRLREALEKIAFGSVTYKIEGGFNQRNRTREEMQEVARAALELNSKPPLPGEKERG
jgi:chromosome segregation ATPase